MTTMSPGFLPSGSCRGRVTPPALRPPPCAACFSRRRFLTECAACVGGLAVLGERLLAAPVPRPVRVRLVFSHTSPEKITWPNVGYDYEGRGRELLGFLRARCPGLEFRPVHVLDAKAAAQVMESDAEVDGYLLYVLGMQGGAPALAEAAGKAGRPLLVVEDQYAGPFSLGFNDRAAKAGWKSLGLATSNLEDIAEVTRCFRVLGRPGAHADDFLSAARSAYRKCIARAGDMRCQPDAVQAAGTAECLRRLRSSKILLVGRDGGVVARAIQEEFGTEVIALKAAELHAAFLRADAGAAAQWADRWRGAAQRVVEPGREDLVKAGAMHVAMQALLQQYGARAISINCLGGFYSGQLQAFPCLGFVELNNGGLVGACEGDLASTITMLAIGDLVGRPGFMSDPVIDLAKNRVIYAHCVAPTRVFGPTGRSNPFELRNHSEDRKGAAVRALLPLGYLTSTMKFVPGKRQLLFHQGRAVENVDEDKACRTKLAVEVKGDVNKLFSGWAAGWHRVTFYGDVKPPVQELCRALKIEFVEEA